jgi:hypothetical protein
MKIDFAQHKYSVELCSQYGIKTEYQTITQLNVITYLF